MSDNKIDSTGTGISMSANNVNNSDQSLLINYYKLADYSQIGKLEKLIGSALDFYIDESVIITEESIEFKMSPKRMISDLNQIVKDGIKYYKYKEISQFQGFSKMAEDKIEEIHQIDMGSFNLSLINDPTEREQMRYYYVQKELNDLKLLLNVEIGNFANNNLLILSSDGNNVLSDEKKAEILDEINKFQTYDPLEPVLIELSDKSVAILQSKDESQLVGNDAPDPFQKKVLELLNQNSQKITILQSKIDSIEMAKISSPNNQADWTQIKSIIEEALANGNVKIDSNGQSGIKNLPDNVSLYFEKGASSLTLGNKLIINEVMDILARNPNIGIIITGYADKLGNSYNNYNLSKKRAGNVRKMALESGVEPYRIMMNYFGSEQSNNPNPGDRKVTIEFVPY